mgnify:CR=1 FL=1
MKIDVILRLFGKVLLTLLGFSSCSKVVEMPSEYGTPNATYRISGSVKTASGEAIGGIQVALKFIVTSTDDDMVPKDTLYTDKSGAFAKEVRSFPVSSVEMLFSDVDGEMNGGEFCSRQVSVTPVQAEKGNGSWYKGSYDVHYDSVLEKKGE